MYYIFDIQGVPESNNITNKADNMSQGLSIVQRLITQG